MITDGQQGECPDWYPVICAARYLGVTPWELMDHSVAWMNIALMAQQAEGEAQEALRNAQLPG